MTSQSQKTETQHSVLRRKLNVAPTKVYIRETVLVRKGRKNNAKVQTNERLVVSDKESCLEVRAHPPLVCSCFPASSPSLSLQPFALVALGAGWSGEGGHGARCKSGLVAVVNICLGSGRG